MKQALEFEKPLLKAREELEEARRRQTLKNTTKITLAVTELEKKVEQLQRETYANLSPWQRVQIARHLNRPYMLDYAKHAFDEFVELHGDRHIGDDNAMPAGFAALGGRRVVLIGQQKGRDTKENLKRRFGMPNPEGYRKALRLMRMADRFHMPIVTLVDTPGAYPGLGAEERGQAEAIAVNLREMARLGVPIVTAVIGEGGSGGALAIAVSNVVVMFENSVYSVISPEGCASILWRDGKKASLAAEALKLTGRDLGQLGIVDGILPEPVGGAHRDPQAAAKTLRDAITGHLERLSALDGEALVEDRLKKFRRMGVFTEEPA
jgi:acetyl-CoA carboxylase carboxyl transferase subunit alpha